MRKKYASAGQPYCSLILPTGFYSTEFRKATTQCVLRLFYINVFCSFLDNLSNMVTSAKYNQL